MTRVLRVVRRLLAATAVLAATLLTATSGAAVAPKEAHDTSALRTAVTMADVRDHLVALDRIARANGGNRAVGTPGYQASVDYVAHQLTTAGYQVTLQPFKAPHFAENAPPTLAVMTAPSTLLSAGQALRAFTPGAEVRTMSYSGAGDVTGPLRPVHLTLPPSAEATSDSGCSPVDFAGFSRGAVALMQRGGCPFIVKAGNARRAGAAAVLIMNEGQPDRRDLVSGSLERPGADIPVLGLSYAAGAELATQPGVPVRVVTSVVSDYQDTVNVIADSDGGRSDRVIMIGAHLDSVPAGPGVNDDGSGVAVVLELATQLARLPGFVPRNRVRFAFWGAEELGMLGSSQYVGRLSGAEREDIAAYLNFDMVGSPNYVRYVYDGDGSAVGSGGPLGSAGLERLFTDYFASQRLPVAPTEFDGRSDYAPFAEVGIPVGGLFSGAEDRKTLEEAQRYGGRAGEPQDPCYHQACDTIDNISEEVLGQFARAAADVVQRLLLSATNPRDLR